MQNETLTWGKCKVVVDDEIVIDNIQENSTNLNTEQGDKKEAIIEGGEVIATRYQRNKYSLEFVEFGKPTLANLDGIVPGNHKVELINCDEGVNRKVFTFPSAVINVQPGFSSEYGTVTTYTCNANRQETGSIVWADDVDEPTITIDASTKKVKITAETGAEIYYTTDGTIPSASSTKYTAEFLPSASCTVKAIAVLSGNYSPCASKIYTKATS